MSIFLLVNSIVVDKYRGGGAGGKNTKVLNMVMLLLVDWVHLVVFIALQ